MCIAPYLRLMNKHLSMRINAPKYVIAGRIKIADVVILGKKTHFSIVMLMNKNNVISEVDCVSKLNISKHTIIYGNISRPGFISR